MLFGERPIEPEKILKAFATDVPAQIDSKTDGTNFVLGALSRLAKENTYCFAPNRSADKGKRCGEFLWDHVWYRKKDENDIVLVAESELGRHNEIHEDFQKLLHAKAPLKLMIFATETHGKQSRKVVEGIEQSYMQKFCQHVEGEEYLLIEFVHPQKLIYSHLFRVPNDRSLERVAFQESTPTNYSVA